MLTVTVIFLIEYCPRIGNPDAALKKNFHQQISKTDSRHDLNQNKSTKENHTLRV